jgi:hypothetical protein
MPGKVIRFSDYERRSHQADAVPDRDPADACQIIILPIIRVVRIEPERRVCR